MFTCCPDCRTVFRLSIRDLQQANGYVRCGECSAVFLALPRLVDTAEDARGLPGREAPVTAAADDQGRGAALAQAAAPTDLATEAAEILHAEFGRRDPQPWPDAPAADGATLTEAAGEAASEGSDSDFSGIGEDTPADASEWWTAPAGEEDSDIGPDRNTPWIADIELLGESETGDPGEPDSLEDTVARDDVPSEASAGRHEPVFSTAAETALGESATPEDGAPADAPRATGDEDTTADATLAEGGAQREAESEGSDDAQSTVRRETPSEEAAHGGGAGEEAEADDEELAHGEASALWQGELEGAVVEASATGRSRPVFWSTLTALLVFALLAQFVNIQRAALAASPQFGAAIRDLYGAVGIRVYPDWNLGNLVLQRKLTPPGETLPGSLRFSATLRNRGPAPMPYPLIRLTLFNRWDEPVGVRMFNADEYMSAVHRDFLPPESEVSAEFVVRDPGEEAYGYRLDTCLPAPAGTVRCQTGETR